MNSFWVMIAKVGIKAKKHTVFSQKYHSFKTASYTRIILIFSQKYHRVLKQSHMYSIQDIFNI